MPKTSSALAVAALGTFAAVAISAMAWKLAPKKAPRVEADRQAQEKPPAASAKPKPKRLPPRWKKVGDTTLVTVKTEPPKPPVRVRLHLKLGDVDLIRANLNRHTELCDSGSWQDCAVVGQTCEELGAATRDELGEATQKLLRQRQAFHDSRAPRPEAELSPALEVTLDHCWGGTRSRPGKSLGSSSLTPFQKLATVLESQPTNYDAKACEHGSDAHCFVVLRGMGRVRSMKHACERGSIPACRTGLPPGHGQENRRYQFFGPDSFDYAVERVFVLEQCLKDGLKHQCPMPDESGLRALKTHQEEKRSQDLAAEVKQKKRDLAAKKCKEGDAAECNRSAQLTLRLDSEDRRVQQRAFRFAKEACRLDESMCRTLGNYFLSGIGTTKDSSRAEAHYRLAAEALARAVPKRCSEATSAAPSTRSSSPRLDRTALEEFECEKKREQLVSLKSLAARINSSTEERECADNDADSCGILVGLALFHEDAGLGGEAVRKLKSLCRSGNAQACILPESRCELGDPLACSSMLDSPDWMTKNAPERALELFKQNCRENGPESLHCNLTGSFERTVRAAQTAREKLKESDSSRAD